MKYIDPDIYNEYKANIDLDCIKEYINFSSFLIRILDENNNNVGYINSSYKVSFKFKDKDKEEFLCNKECQNVVNNLNNEIKTFINHYKTGWKIL